MHVQFAPSSTTRPAPSFQLASEPGTAALIYVAALGSLPPDYYEAAAIDGAGLFGRFRHVTLPQLLPLMAINFAGAFIAAFQGMGSIFLLTFGGPGDATNVLSLVIWKEAYNNLRFSTATTMAWFLGVSLIGFTYLQIRFLRAGRGFVAFSCIQYYKRKIAIQSCVCIADMI